MISLIDRWRIAVLDWVLRTLTTAVDRGYEAWAHADTVLGSAMATVVLIYVVVIVLWAAWLAWCAIEMVVEGVQISWRRRRAAHAARAAADRDDAARDARVRATALTGTTDGLPRSVWEGDQPPAGGSDRAA